MGLIFSWVRKGFAVKHVGDDEYHKVQANEGEHHLLEVESEVVKDLEAFGVGGVIDFGHGADFCGLE